jgi:Asp-tRNA(Asn)/Glu-tRNA(Gln) amidotransferase A subunit family amidase
MAITRSPPLKGRFAPARDSTVAAKSPEVLTISTTRRSRGQTGARRRGLLSADRADVVRLPVVYILQISQIISPERRGAGRLVVPIGEDHVDRNGVLSNGTGFPALTFPGRFSAPTASALVRVPVGIELLGPEWSEPASGSYGRPFGLGIGLHN